jgi:hypothetical protein
VDADDDEARGGESPGDDTTLRAGALDGLDLFE